MNKRVTFCAFYLLLRICCVHAVIGGIAIAGTETRQPEGTSRAWHPPRLIVREYKVPPNFLELSGSPEAGAEFHWRIGTESMEQDDGRSAVYVEQKQKLVVQGSVEDQREAAARVKAAWKKYKESLRKPKR
jgi:hypothetical protein